MGPKLKYDFSDKFVSPGPGAYDIQSASQRYMRDHHKSFASNESLGKIDEGNLS
jgi:hypothetical protein